MEESTRVWINKIESKLDQVSTEFTRGFAQLSTKLDIYLNKQDDHENRIRQLEERQNKQDGVNEDSKKRWNHSMVILLGAEILLVAAGVAITYMMKG